MTTSNNKEPPALHSMSADSKKKLSLWQICGLVILGVLLLLSTQFVWVCHNASFSFSVENRLDVPIIVQLNGYDFDELASGKRQGYSTVRGRDAYYLQVIDASGTLLLEQAYTEKELDSADTIVIEES